jgi:reactive intermediate/imine deaminase
MSLKQVHTQPDPYAPFLISQGIKTNGLVFVYGQAAIGNDGNLVGMDDFDKQDDQAFHNLDRVLKAAGSSLDRVIKVTIYLTLMSHLEKIVELRRKWWSQPYPAETIVEVSSLYSPDAMIEIDVIALDEEN